MIKEVYINTIDELMKLFQEQEFQPHLNRYRSSFIYRGESKIHQKMTTSLRRNCKDKSRQIEPAILKNFAKYAVLDDPSIEDSVWKLMMAGQHHGLPTRLLDFTHSPLIALQFAAVENMDEMDKEDCVVWRIDMAEVHNQLPEKYQDVIKESQSKIYTIDNLESVVDNIQQYDEDMGDSAMVIIEPSSIDERIVNQYAFFALIPSEMEDIEGFLDKYTNNTVKYIINKSLRWQIADSLDAFNISERIIYPGLDGLSKWIARHYYVRDTEPEK